jgi:hypothetical protein
MTESPTQLGPRPVAISTLFFKTLAGLGAGFLGAVILGIFTMTGLQFGGSPFASFAAILMGLITALATNTLAVFFFGMIESDRFPALKPIIGHVFSLNVLIFVFLLPAYLIGAAWNEKAIYFITSLQFILAAQASILMLELSDSNSRDNLLSIYGATFGMLIIILLNLVIFWFVDASTATVVNETGEATSSGASALLFSVPLLTWACFGFFTSLVASVYRWIYTTWGVDFLNRNV